MRTLRQLCSKQLRIYRNIIYNFFFLNRRKKSKYPKEPFYGVCYIHIDIKTNQTRRAKTTSHGLIWCSSCRRMEAGAGLSPPSHVTDLGAVSADEPRTAMGRKIFQDGEVACSRNVPAGHSCPSHLTGALWHAALAPSCLLPQLSTEGCWTRLEGLQQLMEVMLTIKRASKGEESLSFTAQVLHGFPCPRAGKVGRWELWVQSASTAVLSQGHVCLLGRQLLICFGMYRNGLKSNLGIKGGKKKHNITTRAVWQLCKPTGSPAAPGRAAGLWSPLQRWCEGATSCSTLQRGAQGLHQPRDSSWCPAAPRKAAAGEHHVSLQEKGPRLAPKP